MDVMEVRDQVRMQEWAGFIKERNASGMTIKEWCRARGTSESQYYYWLRKIRHSACTVMKTCSENVAQENEEAPVFAEINVLSDTVRAETDSGIRIRINQADIHIGKDVPADQLTAVMKVIAYAE